MPPRSTPVKCCCEACEREFYSIGTRLPIYCSQVCKRRVYRTKQRNGTLHKYTRPYCEEEDVMG